MAAVVRPGRHFIDHQAAVLQHKKLNAQHTHVVHPLGNGTRSRHGKLLQSLWQVTFVNFCHGQDTLAMQIALHWEIHHLTIAAARHNDRAL